MSLPAGFAITSIDGLRCTAVPKASTTLPPSLAILPAATFTSTSSTALPTLVPPSSNPDTQSSAASPTGSPPVAATPLAASTPVSSFVTSTSAVILSTSSTSAILSATAIPGPRISTPTTSSSSAVAVAQSEVSASSSALSGNDNGSGFKTPSKTTSSSSSNLLASTSQTAESSASSGISSNPQVTAAPVVGGVVGSVALIALVALLFYFFRRRRRGRESLLTPLTTGRRSSFYDADNASEGPSASGGRWKSKLSYEAGKIGNVGSGIKIGIIGLGASLKSKVGGSRSATPNVNLNRGNSQFMDGPIPQHSRNNSVLSQSEKPSLRERASDWWERLSDRVSFAWRMRMKNKESEDPFAAARSMSEKQANMSGTPDFSQLLRMDDRELQLQAERRRISLAGNTNSLPQLGSLGLNFGSMSDDPFADPVNGSSKLGWRPPPSTDPANKPFADSTTDRSNPFADPPTKPGATIPKANTYIADIRRSRGQSIDNTTSKNTMSMYRPPSTTVASRYPSSIAPSRDSYRDTVFSSFSANARKGKGRSDPFDLERPELWRPKEANNPALYPAALKAKSGTVVGPPGTDSRIMSNASYLSKYSSGMSMGEWGDPGPDLGPASRTSSLQRNTSSNGSQAAYSPIGYSAAKTWDANRDTNNVSPLSRTSSKGGVGKAM